MQNRQALEDAVYDSYPDIDMSQIERMPIEKLEWLINLTNGKCKTPGVRQPKPEIPKWQKMSAGYEVRDGQLMFVEKWRILRPFDETWREYVNLCSGRVFYEGRTVSSSILKYYLTTGEWVKRIPKPAKHRAIVRIGKKVIHLGYFATLEQKEAAIFAFKLGIV